MILKNQKVLDIQRLGDTDEGIEAGISNDSLPFMFEILSTKFYSNPIGSIIREIVSNCFDSHLEAGVDDPVIIRKGYDAEEGFFIEFQDFGVGLSVERIYNVYMNYFSSTKRGTNDLIGGFGLGSKTPLSYADYFYITTTFNGLKYSYIYHKGEKIPTLESLNGYSYIDEEYLVETAIGEDGEEIELEEPIVRTRQKKIPTGVPTEDRNGTTIRVIMENLDTAKFQKELSLQLSYFDNVYFENWSVSNSYEIYEGKYFVFRSDIDQVSTKIHICIGKVRYAIDFNQIKIDREYIGIPIGIKFEIGELQITPNRESITYNDESNQLIQNRLLLAVQELTDMYNNQNPEIETLDEYVRLAGARAKIVFNKEKNHAIDLWSYSTLSKKFKFKPLAELGLKNSPAILFFGWEIIGYISSGIYTPNRYNSSVSNANIAMDSFIVIDKDTRFSKYTDIYIGELYGDVTVIRKKPFNFYDAERHLEIKSSKVENGKAKLIYRYSKIIEGIVNEKALGNYKNLKPTDEWIAEYKKRIREESLAFQRRKNKTVFLRQAPGFSGKTIREYDLNHRTGILIYGFKEDRAKLESIWDLVCYNVKTIKDLNYNKMQKAFMVVQIAKNIETSIIGAKKTVYWEDFLRTKFFANIYSAKWLTEKIYSSNIRTDERLKSSLIPGYEEDMRKLDILVQRYVNYEHVRFNSLLGPDDSKIKLNPEMVKMYNYLSSKYLDIKIPFQNTIDRIPYDEEDKKDYIEYLKYRKLRLRNEFYLKDDRQVIYENNIRTILNTIKGRVKPQLLLTINQNENVNENSDSKTGQDNEESILSQEDRS